MNRQALNLYTRMWSNCGPHVRVYILLQNCNSYGIYGWERPREQVLLLQNIETLNPRNSKVVWPGDEIIELYVQVYEVSSWVKFELH